LDYFLLDVLKKKKMGKFILRILWFWFLPKKIVRLWEISHDFIEDEEEFTWRG